MKTPTTTTVSTSPANPSAARASAPAHAKAELARKYPSSAQLRSVKGLPADQPGQALGLVGSVLGDPDLHPAALGAGLAQASRLTNSTAPMARAIAA